MERNQTDPELFHIMIVYPHQYKEIVMVRAVDIEMVRAVDIETIVANAGG